MRPDKLMVFFFPKMNRSDFSLSCPCSGQKNSSHSLTAAKKPLIICGCFHAAKFTAYHIQFLFLHCAPIRRTCQIDYISYHLPILFLFLRIFPTGFHLNQFKFLIHPQFQPVFQIPFHIKSILLVIV